MWNARTCDDSRPPELSSMQSLDGRPYEACGAWGKRNMVDQGPICNVQRLGR
jgi:hypothetical protein